jgi:hypothetical protein
MLAILAALVLAPADPLADGFRNPPSSAKPHTWWHWMDGNVTREGITADLEAMKEVGIGGAQMFTVAQDIPKGEVGYMSPAWRAMTAHAVREAARLGIELCLHNCAGWSSSGGPWVKPEQAMQVLAWSEVNVSGPRRFDEPLPKPEAPQVHAKVDYYRDVAVFAFRAAHKSVRPTDFLGRTGVNRQDRVEPSLAAVSTDLPIPLSEMYDISDRLVDGRLNWDVPPGDWTILRMGHVPTGKNNHPAPPEGDGLEVDKLSREALDAFWDGIMAKVLADAGQHAGKVLNNALVDSYEVGGQNWTPKFREEFARRRGYDPSAYLPAITGRIVESRAATERFLWDFRKTISDLFADNYFGYFAEKCREAGLLFSTEPYGNGGFDNIECGGKADIPMGEFWIGGGTLETTKLAASVGHVYGRKFIGAESFTAAPMAGRWLFDPYTTKTLGDLVFCNGINRYIFHRYAHQPWMDRYPGMTMGQWGTHFERTQTWWTEAKEWLRYVSRCQFMLQSGTFVGDVLYFYGETSPVDLPYRPSLSPRMPDGYDYDGCDVATLNRLRVRDGALTLPNGARYRVLVLPESKFMTPATVERISTLVAAGATVVGQKPEHSPTLEDYPQSEVRLRQFADSIWGDVDGTAHRERSYGRGRIIWGIPLQDVLGKLNVKRDFEYVSHSGGANLAYIHRKIGDDDAYFVSNQRYQQVEVDCTFRASGKQPELWRPDTGVIENAPVFRSEMGRTVVQMRLGPAESVFVVFRKQAPRTHVAKIEPSSRAAAPPPPKVEIRLARYEAPDGRGADVTAIVAEMVHRGEYEIPATNAVFGDPVVNVVKQLRIEYAVDGKPMSKTVAENETLSLIAPPPHTPPTYEVVADGSGASVIAWRADSFTVTHSDGRRSIVSVGESPVRVAVSGAWNVRFKQGWGAPAFARFDTLMSWTESEKPGIKYFSGSATYSKTVSIPAEAIGRGRKIVLDLGRVKNFATVIVNGREFPPLWKEPFAIDVGDALRTGRNTIEVKVTNLWPNRIIGDEQHPPDVEWRGRALAEWPEWFLKKQPRPSAGRFTFTTWRLFEKDSPLLESGLLGPVEIRSAKRIPLRR